MVFYLSPSFVNVCVCISFLCEGVHHSQSVKPDLWDAETRSHLFFLYSIIPTRLLWIHLLMPLNSMWSFLLSLCPGLFPSLVFPLNISISARPVFCLSFLPAWCFCHSCRCCAASLSSLWLNAFPSPQSHPELSRNTMAPINLERWYQDIMAAGEPRPCPPPLPAKSFSARRHSQVNSPLFFSGPDAYTLSWTPDPHTHSPFVMAFRPSSGQNSG